MPGQEEYSEKEAQRQKKLKAEETEQAARDQERKKAYLAREHEIEKGQKSMETRQAEKRAAEDIKDSAREKARKAAYIAQEKKIAEVQEARRLKDDQTHSS